MTDRLTVVLDVDDPSFPPNDGEVPAFDAASGKWHSYMPVAGVTDHSGLSGVTSDQHHAKSHLHDGLDGSGTVSHADLTSIGTDDHHTRYTDAEAIAAVEGSPGGIDHGSLSGLGDDDHGIYLLIDGTRAMTGDLDMGGNDITNAASLSSTTGTLQLSAATDITLAPAGKDVYPTTAGDVNLGHTNYPWYNVHAYVFDSRKDDGGYLYVRRNDTSIVAGDRLGGLFYGGTNTGGSYQTTASIEADSIETWGAAGDYGTRFDFFLTAAGASARTNVYRMMDTVFQPLTGNPDLGGGSGGEWGDIYLSGDIKGGTSLDFALDGTNYVVLTTTQWRPVTAMDNLVDLGGATQRWKDAYLAGTLYASVLRASGATDGSYGQVVMSRNDSTDTDNYAIFGEVLFKDNSLTTRARIRGKRLGTDTDAGYMTWEVANQATGAMTEVMNLYEGKVRPSQSSGAVDLGDATYYWGTVYGNIFADPVANAELRAASGYGVFLSVGTETQYIASTAAFRPTQTLDNARDLGAIDARWNDIYLGGEAKANWFGSVSGNVQFRVAGTTEMTLSATALYPNGGNTLDLGDDSNYWDDIFGQTVTTEFLEGASYGSTVGRLHVRASERLYFGSQSTWRWYLDDSGNLVPYADLSYTFGVVAGRVKAVHTGIVTTSIASATISADTNDWNPTGLHSNGWFRVTVSGAARNLTGINAGVEGEELVITNISATYGLILVDESGSSTAANRIIVPSGEGRYSLAQDQSAKLKYDSTSARWRIISGNGYAYT